MLCVPTARLAVLQLAVLLFALPVGSATAAQPLSVVPSALKATLPVGATPLTVAVKVTLAPTVAGLTKLANAVVLVALLTTCEKMGLVEPALVASPLYTALML